ncbi:MAG: NADH-quinone oxidoreductase subunit H [Thermosphaera sp.]|nr:NADH-quinone oxidoreductase subunit H [Thermosphaera sp.]
MEFILLTSTSITVLLVNTILPVIMDGVERKIKARIQSRIGPPIVQTLYDLLKLLEKEVKPLHIMPFILLTIIAYLSTIIASLYFINLYTITGEAYYSITAITLFAISLTSNTLTPLLLPSPFTYTGGMREVILSIVNEPAFIVSFVLASTSLRLLNLQSPNIWILIALSISLTTLVLSSYAITGRIPFDIAEAEPEIASGVLLEFSGKILALLLLSNLIKRFIVKYIVSSLILVYIIGAGLTCLAASILLTIALWIIYAIVAAILGRSRVDLAPITLGKVYILLLALSITVLLVGIYGG